MTSRIIIGAFLFLAAVFPSFGLSIDYEIETDPSKRRAKLEDYVYKLSVLVEYQIDELSGLISPSESEKARDDHYSWKLNRDVKCAEAGRNSNDQNAELDCLAVETEKYFEELEARLAMLESKKIGENSHEDAPSISAPH